MLEAKDSHAIDNVLPLIRGNVDKICGMGKNAEITRALIWYVKNVNYLFQRYELLVWSKEALAKLQKYIWRFKISARKAVQEYLAASMLTQKFHI